MSHLFIGVAKFLRSPFLLANFWIFFRQELLFRDRLPQNSFIACQDFSSGIISDMILTISKISEVQSFNQLQSFPLSN
jgi:hypothetical protein